MLCMQCEDFCKETGDRLKIIRSDDKDSLPSTSLQWPHYIKVLHNGLQGLNASSSEGCQICRIIQQAPTQYQRSQLSDDAQIFLEIKCHDGAHPVLWAAYRHKDGKEPFPQQMIAISSGVLEDDEAANLIDDCGKLDNSSTGSKAMIRLASFWLNRCLSSHGDCPKPNAVGVFVPTRLIDVGDDINAHTVKLIETADGGVTLAERQYVALSHCWGKDKIITTTTDTLDSRLESIPLSALSNTFRDAVQTVRNLKFRYLWIDSLCIIQDSKDDWRQEAATMSRVYSNAIFTIGASHASSGDVGCFVQRDGLLQLPLILYFPSQQFDDGKTKNTRMLFNSMGRSRTGIGPNPPLYGRAWVYQEQVLSPRMLLFDGEQLRWICLCAHGSDPSPFGGLTRNQIHLEYIRRKIVNEADEFFRMNEHEDPEFEWRYMHMAWCYAVMDFTYRGMSRKSDRLIAIAGIGNAIQQKTKNRYLAGMWKDHLWLGLLWSIPHQMEEHLPTTWEGYDVEGNTQIRHEKELAPSWSWASVTSPVVYPVPAISQTFLRRMCEIKDCQVKGAWDSQSGKLDVRGHVRIAYVNSIYPYLMQEAKEKVPHMFFTTSRWKEDLFTHSGRSFPPSSYFLFSPTKPNIRTYWHLVRGKWRPDEVLDSKTPITFLAIAQVSQGSKIGWHMEGDPLEVYTIGLVPTRRAKNEYRRVGYGVWADCTWYGYQCGEIDYKGMPINRDTGLKGRLWRMMELGAGKNPAVEKPGPDGHPHTIHGDGIPELELYHKGIEVEERTLRIV